MESQNAVNIGGQQFTDNDVLNRITEGIASLREVFAGYVHTFTDSQRRHLLRTGLKNRGFAGGCFKAAKQYPEPVPGDVFYRDGLSFYEYVKDAAEVVYKMLKPRFETHGKQMDNNQ